MELIFQIFRNLWEFLCLDGKFLNIKPKTRPGQNLKTLFSNQINPFFKVSKNLFIRCNFHLQQIVLITSKITSIQEN